MNQYEREYELKKVELTQIYDMIRTGDFICISYNALEPVGFLRNLHTIKDRVENVTLRHGGLWYDYPFAGREDMKGHFKAITTFYDSFCRSHHTCRLASLVPGNMHNNTERVLEDHHINMYYGLAAPMDKNGFVRVPLNLVYEMDAIRSADIVVLQIDRNLPMVSGENLVHIRDIDYIVEMDEPVITIEDTIPSETEMQIGQYVAELVPDGATIQLGIGKIPNAVGSYLAGKKDLGVHTEMITSIIAELAEAGVITGRRKTLHRELIVGAFALGSQRLYDFLDGNPQISLRSASYVNNPFIIAKNEKMTSINTCLQIDLTGQICSESLGTRQFSGPGGAADFAIGASHSKGGKSIIAVKSTAKNGTVSTIQPTLYPGGVVTITRNDIDYIVTEYGVAKMKGKSIDERVDGLIQVAHPKFREELRFKADEYEIW